MRFSLGATLISHEIHVMCDYPQAEQPFKGGNYHELNWICKHQYDPDRYAKIVVNRAGTFHFKYYSRDDDDELVSIIYNTIIL